MANSIAVGGCLGLRVVKDTGHKLGAHLIRPPDDCASRDKAKPRLTKTMPLSAIGATAYL